MFKYIILLFTIILLSCSYEPPTEPLTTYSTYTQKWYKDSLIYGTRKYILTNKGDFQFLQNSESNKVQKVNMNGWYDKINDSVIQFNWSSIMDIYLHQYWNDTIYYHTYGIFSNNDSIMKVILNNGKEAHPYGKEFILE